MKTLVLYKSKYGSTEMYAKWIAEALGADISTMDYFKAGNLGGYSVVLIGSPTYMGKILAADFLIKNWTLLEDKQVYLFTVGMIPWETQESNLSYQMIPQNIRDKIQFIKVPGRMDINRLNVFEKMITSLRKAESADLIDQKYIQPVIDYVKGLNA